MSAFSSPHQVYCYTGIHSYAAAILLRHSLGEDVQVHLSSQREIIAHLRELHQKWVSEGKAGVKTVAVLGPLVHKDVLADQVQPSIVTLLDEMARSGVRVDVFNEYEDLVCFKGTAVCHHLAEKPIKENKNRPMLAGKVAEVFKDNDPLEIRDALRKHELEPEELEKRSNLILALEWVFVETIQYREAEHLVKVVKELGSVNHLTKDWENRARIQMERGRGVLIGESYAEPLSRARGIARSDLPVIILGETGSGKEMMARRIHDASGRWDHPFVAESCANFTENLFEAELYGTIQGAFTGSVNRKGLLEYANGGTLFLDEIGELSPINQGKLLRVLQEKRYRRVGDTEVRRVNIRLIAATNLDLYSQARQGKFRLDLWYRLAGEVIHLKPLREIPKDLHAIANHLLIQLSNDDSEILAQRRKDGKGHGPVRFERKDTECLKSHTWPGNVRELRLAVHRHLATGRSLETIVQELVSQERSLLNADDQAIAQLPPLDSSEVFAVHGLQPIDKIQSDYLHWADKNSPMLTRKQLSKALGVSTELLRTTLGPSRKRMEQRK